MKAMSRPGSTRASLGAFSLLSVLFLQTFCAVAQEPQSSTNASAKTPTSVLIELFTSEGCSSCPPADVLLKRLDASQPITGAQLIVLSEHVTYWDHDGWKDPNSSEALTERQNSYERVLGESTAFTPQLIVDGTQQMRAGNPQQVEETLRKAASIPKVLVRIGDVTVDATNPNVLRAHIEADASSEKHNADVYAAVALDRVESQVLRGENGGKHLVHVAVVQGLTRVGKLSKGKPFAQDVQLKLKPGTDPKNIRIVALVQESGQGKVLGAALQKPAL
jgi:hypothetical protein